MCSTRPDNDTAAARAAAAAAMRQLRDAAGEVLATLADAQPVAPHHLLALRALAAGARTPGDVAEATGRHASSVSRVIDQLVDEDLVARRPDPADRRQVLLSLTTAGQDVIGGFEALDHAISARMVADFDRSDAEQLTVYLARLSRNASQLADELHRDPDILDDLP